MDRSIPCCGECATLLAESIRRGPSTAQVACYGLSRAFPQILQKAFESPLPSCHDERAAWLLGGQAIGYAAVKEHDFAVAKAVRALVLPIKPDSRDRRAAMKVLLVELPTQPIESLWQTVDTGPPMTRSAAGEPNDDEKTNEDDNNEK